MASKFRHEWKHEINYSDMLILRQRLSAVMQRDENAKDGKYFIRSLYFDNLEDKALLEKLNGVSKREKFRIRIYNGDASLIKLEKKSKTNGLCLKEIERISAEETEKIISGETEWLSSSKKPLLRELGYKMKTESLLPKTVVDYTREAFVFPAGNVRVTLDYDIRTGINQTDILNPDLPTVPAGTAPIILEVKWDEFLPDIIRDIVQLESRRSAAFSKYATCRIYG
ncbi:MAG: polyphosphate polymerase domain-containing protein [Oscillospiraceae bacterium]|nr:polyphosphate polymerase domain-containing protein [Oscillospiraceae bacterium]